MAVKKVLTGAIAIVVVDGKAVGLMKDIRDNEDVRRMRVGGIGTVLPQELPVTEWNGSISCSFYEIDFASSGIPKAIRRDVGVGNAASQVAAGNNNANFEDNLVLDDVGVQLNIFKKVKDVIDPNTGLIIPNRIPYAIITRCFIEVDGVTISEGNVSGRDQSFKYLDPIVYNA